MRFRAQTAFPTCEILRYTHLMTLSQTEASRLTLTLFPPQQHSQTPRLNARWWSLTIGGAVDLPITFSLDDLKTFPMIERHQAIVCAAVGGDMHEAVWRGVTLSDLLEEVMPLAADGWIRLIAADGYSAVLSHVRLERAMLALEKDGAPLSPDEGFPARLIVAGVAGYKMPKWIERIEFSLDTPSGTWEARDWSLDGMLPPRIALHTPYARQTFTTGTRITLSGTAFAGTGALNAIELSIDDAPFSPIAFTQPHGNALARWSFVWRAPAPGDYRFAVRTSGMGALSDEASVIVVVEDAV